MASPPPPPPPPPPPAPASPKQWAMLRRVPQLSRIHLGQDAFSLAVAAPPDLTRLSISQIAASDKFLDDRFPFVLAADPSGLLLITDSYGRATDPLGADLPVYFVWDVVKTVTHRLRRHQESVNHSGNVGLIITPDSIYGRSFMVVELLPVSAGESITILCYKSDSRLWVKKKLSSSMLYYPWSSANVFSYNCKLWWVDLRHGILSCDPLPDTPQSILVQFPSGAASVGKTPLMRGDISKHRCVNLSDGKLRFVEITGSAYRPTVTMWTLVDAKTSTWEQNYDVNLRDIWDDESYREANLQKRRPVLAGVHPADPAVVYFLNKEKLFGVNLCTKKVDDCVLFQPAATDPTALDIDEESSRFLLTWDLPPSLTSSSGQMHGEGSSGQMNGERSSRGLAFDTMVKSFMNAYTSAFGTLEYDELARIAIMSLNQTKKKQENKFRLSERHLLCSFEEKNATTSALTRYAHMNFYVHRDSKTKRLRQLVFAEFAKVDKDSSWSLLLCKILTKTSQGGLYNANADVGQKRKRSSCFACDSEIKHPNTGFQAGHLHAT